MEDVNTTNGNKAAFPSTDGRTFATDGLTKREHIATEALKGILSNYLMTNYSQKEKVQSAISYADEMLKQLELTLNP
jgi:hypothetical protein